MTQDTPQTTPSPRPAHPPKPRGGPLSLVDDLLGRVTMYRLVTIVLVALVVVSFGLTWTSSLIQSVFTTEAMALTLVVVVAASVLSNVLLGLVWRIRPHLESSVITALLLWFLYWPSSDASTLAWLAGVAVLANVSKYVLAFRGRHVLNPAAAGVVLMLLLQELLQVDPASRVYTTWWVANEPALLFVAIGALVVLRRTHRLAVGATFVAVTAAVVVGGLVNGGATLGDAVTTAFWSYPIVFLAGFMLSEPLTLPPRRRQQLAVAVLAALVFAWPQLQSLLLPPGTTIDLWIFESTPELALVAANLVGFALGQRRGVRLQVVGHRELAPGTWEVAFEPLRPVRFMPGQYVELHVPHAGADRRGVRRVFSISSAPDAAHVTIALRVPERSSSFKRALLDAEPGTVVTATSVGGDFLLPADEPAVLVAGGIGITPFASQLRHPTPERRQDLVLVYGVPDGPGGTPPQVAYRDELVATGVPVVLVSPTPPTDLPAGWRHVAAPGPDADVLAEAVPDLAARRAYVSGPPAMVHAVRRSLRGRCAGVRTDYFSGY